MAKAHKFGLDVKVYKDGASYTSTVCVKDRNPSEDGNKRCGVELGASTMKGAVASAMRDLADNLAPGARRGAAPGRSRSGIKFKPTNLVVGGKKVTLSAKEVRVLQAMAADWEVARRDDDPEASKVAGKINRKL